jgi:hypothetical protein
MAYRNSYILAGVCFLLAGARSLPAQTKDLVEIFAGYDYTNATVDTTLPKSGLSGIDIGVGGWATNWFGIAAEFSKQYGTVGAATALYASGSNIHFSTYMAGPQFRFLNTKYVNVGARALFGGIQGQVFQSASTASQTRFSGLFAVTLDVTINKYIAWRVEPGVDVTTFGAGGSPGTANQSGFRISTGPVFRFGSHEH